MDSKIINPTNAFWTDIVLYRSNLVFNSNQVLVLFGQTQILRATRHKNLQKKSNEDFRIFLQSLLSLPTFH